MKKTYMKPVAEAIRVEKALLSQTSSVGLNNTEVNNETNLLGHDDEFDW